MGDREYVAFDLETTGLSVKTDRIIEIGAVKFREGGAVVGEFSTLVNPEQPIPLVIQRLTGLTDDAVGDAPVPAEAVAEFADFCEGSLLVAHGSTFDMAFCSRLLPDTFGRRFVFDTLELARLLLPMAPSHSLPILAVQLNLLHDTPHRASSDAEATRALFAYLITVAESLSPAVLSQIRAVVGRDDGPLSTFFYDVVSGEGGAAFNVHEVPRESVAPVRAPVQSKEPLADAVRRVFALEGENRDYRESQVQMAQIVSQALERHHHVVIEAPTGVGKSWGYLVPLALWVLRSKQRAVVATDTVALQDQLMAKEIPRLLETCSSALEVATLKGQRHYLCTWRWRRFLAQGGPGPESREARVRFTVKVLCWLTVTLTGDCSELRLTHDEESLWRHVRADSRSCAVHGCSPSGSNSCFLMVARERAGRAHIVLTNHAMVIADREQGGKLLGAYNAVVMDEGHHLEDAATAQLGVTLCVDDLLEDVDRLIEVYEENTHVALDETRRGCEQLFGEMKGYIARETGGHGNVVLTLDRARRDSLEFLALQRHISLLCAHIEEALRSLDASEESLASARPLADAVLDSVKKISEIFAGPREGRAAWLSLRREQAEIHEVPVHVDSELRDRLFSVVDTVVVVSATLSVGGEFAFTKQRLGMSEGVEAISLSSPFDFLRQAVCVVPNDFPSYDEAGYDEVLASTAADIARRLGGRTLMLFTSYSALQRIHTLLDKELARHRIAVLGQGIDGTRRQVLSSFLAHPRAVLLGTNSLWEGIDIPGDALSCVIIAKIPFPVPTDPLVRARSESYSRSFDDYIIPRAALKLAQGFGRLIRTTSDRGAVVVCDARLTTHRYADELFAALPKVVVAYVPGEEIGNTVEEFVIHQRLPEGSVREEINATKGYDDHAA